MSRPAPVRLYTTHNGSDYVVVLYALDNGVRDAYARVVRKLADGSEVEAFLSHRQAKTERAVLAKFAREIAAWKAEA